MVQYVPKALWVWGNFTDYVRFFVDIFSSMNQETLVDRVGRVDSVAEAWMQRKRS